MRLKIDTEPKINTLEFRTLEDTYAQTQSPRSVIKKTGLEFDHFRQYQAEDDSSQIDWIASSRTQDLLVRVYREDTSLNVLIGLDVSESMIYGTGNKAKIEYAIEIALNLAYGILGYGDSVGLLIFNTDIVATVPFRNRLSSFEVIKSTLLDSSKFGGKVNMEKPLFYSTKLFAQTHLFILISDFIGDVDNYLSAISGVADKYDIIGLMVYDKTDMELDSPIKLMQLKGPYTTDNAGIINAKNLAEDYKHANMERVARIKDYFTAMKKSFWMFGTDEMIGTKLRNLVLMRNYIGK